MPIVEMVRQGNDFISFRYGFVPPISINPDNDTFQPGVTMPRYTPTLAITNANKNIGNLPQVSRTEYSSTVSGGVTQLSTATTINNTNFTNTVVDIRADIIFNNCHFILTNYTAADSINALIRILNGGGTTNVIFNDCEFHIRSQRTMNCVSGRNATFNRCVFTGGVDGLSLSSSGSGTQSYGFVVNDSWIGDHAWWYAPSVGVVHTSDTQTHNDGIQVSVNLGVEVKNTFFATWPSEFVGTGTPNSGSETNSFSATYISDQSTMESWRTTYLNRYTRADQSFETTSRRTSTGGSWAGIMINRPNVVIDSCWFSGSTVHINATDSNLAGQNVGTIIRNRHWNDMSAGHDLTTTDKGTAIYTLASSTYTLPTSGNDKNIWFDNATVIPVNQ